MSRPNVTDVPGVSDARRFPRLGVIRLGVKVPATKDKKEHPKNIPYFVLPEELEKVYGKECSELPVMLPVDDERIVFPVSMRYYGSGKGLKCQGDGKGHGYRYHDDRTLVNILNNNTFICRNPQLGYEEECGGTSINNNGE